MQCEHNRALTGYRDIFEEIDAYRRQRDEQLRDQTVQLEMRAHRVADMEEDRRLQVHTDQDKDNLEKHIQERLDRVRRVGLQSQLRQDRDALAAQLIESARSDNEPHSTSQLHISTSNYYSVEEAQKRYDRVLENATRVLAGDNALSAIHTVALPSQITEGDTVRPDIVATHCRGSREFKLDWYLCSRRAYPEYNNNEIPDGTWVDTAPEYRCKLNDVGRYIKLVVTDNAHSYADPTVVFSGSPVKPGTPKILQCQILGELSEGSVITLLYVYFGHLEGKTKIRWFREGHQVGSEDDKTYELGSADVGYKISAEVTPIRADGMVGTPKVAYTKGKIKFGLPRVEAVEIVGDWKCGAVLKVEPFGKMSPNLVDPIIKWYRIDSTNVAELVQQSNDSGAGRDHHEYHTTIGDGNKFIRVEYTPVRKDGVVGLPVTCTTRSTIQKLVYQHEEPHCTLKIHGSCVEGQTLAASYTVTTGNVAKTRSHIQWMRDGELVSQDWSYTAMYEDIGHVIRCEMHPVSAQGVQGAACAASTGIILPAQPHIVDYGLMGTFVPSSVIKFHRKYVGGQERGSTYQWDVVRGDSSYTVAKNVDVLTLTKDMVGAYLQVTYVARRVDGTESRPIKCRSPHPVQRATPVVQSHSMRGIPEEGRLLKAVVDVLYPTKAAPPKITWFRRTNGVETQIAHNTLTWRCLHEDVGKSIKFEYKPLSAEGEEGEMVYAISPVIQPGRATVERCHIPQQAYVGHPLTPQFTLCGTNVHTVFCWSRSRDGHKYDSCMMTKKRRDRNFVEAPTYNCTADDLYHFIQSRITPISTVDNEKGPEVEVNRVCRIHPNTQRQLQEAFLLGQYKFVVPIEGHGNCQVLMTRSHLNITKASEGDASKTTGLVSARWSMAMKVKLDKLVDNIFHIIVPTDDNKGEHNFKCIAPHPPERDTMVLHLRVYLGMVLPQCAVSVLGVHASECWDLLSTSPKHTSSHSLVTSLQRAWVPPLEPLEQEERNHLTRQVQAHGELWFYCLNAIRALVESESWD